MRLWCLREITEICLDRSGPIDTIYQSSRSLGIVDDFLNVSRIEQEDEI